MQDGGGGGGRGEGEGGGGKPERLVSKCGNAPSVYVRNVIT